MSKVLILFSSRDGQTLKIINKIQSELDQDSDLVNINEAATIDFTQYTKVLVGASIRYGNFESSVIPFLNKHKDELHKKPNAFFVVCLTARKPEKASPATSAYMMKFDRLCEWQPKMKGVFAGALTYSKYNWWQTLIIQLIMKMTGGSTDKTKDLEFTDWQRVETFGKDFNCL
ncbi:menaquinone-dependent protoporphyrinogen IX dehydrogenase [Motilimonas sp. 1_MG-2023]|uniref:menaquinone-dependent protoporphyrinogen IX dehydrogenase n=1 Tax=Motilimonas TaxID=1914248 RepID=UPI0026E24D5D|nr:menaquinone-dependent protoporphyrinogen IX dehydrogenase [Motilimonas sp. 1_MG-2023]MDO6527063.1 menaquinone-dependent protoporphyrinogen IX dehydrogenase [Motilimonas sp. 1_MG-2023]